MALNPLERGGIVYFAERAPQGVTIVPPGSYMAMQGRLAQDHTVAYSPDSPPVLMDVLYPDPDAELEAWAGKRHFEVFTPLCVVEMINYRAGASNRQMCTNYGQALDISPLPEGAATQVEALLRNSVGNKILAQVLREEAIQFSNFGRVMFP